MCHCKLHRELPVIYVAHQVRKGGTTINHTTSFEYTLIKSELDVVNFILTVRVIPNFWELQLKVSEQMCKQMAIM